jgi:uncharacterized protein YukE
VIDGAQAILDAGGTIDQATKYCTDQIDAAQKEAVKVANYGLSVAQEAEGTAEAAYNSAKKATEDTAKAVNTATNAVSSAAQSVAHWGNEVATWTQNALSAQNIINGYNQTINACNQAIGTLNNTINSLGNTITNLGNDIANEAKKAWHTISNPKKWFSDLRLKENVKFAGVVAGLNTYTYNYVWSNERNTGVMAQELLNTEYADAVSVHESGYYQVDYNKLPI